MQEGVDDFLLSLIVLGCVSDCEGNVWRRSANDIYVIEAMPIVRQEEGRGQNLGRMEEKFVHQIFNFVPSLQCWSPMESFSIFLGTSIFFITVF